MTTIKKIVTSILLFIALPFAALAQDTNGTATITITGIKSHGVSNIGCYYFNSDQKMSQSITVQQDGDFTFTAMPNPQNILGPLGPNVLSCTYSAGLGTMHINCKPVIPGSTVDIAKDKDGKPVSDKCHFDLTKSPQLEVQP